MNVSAIGRNISFGRAFTTAEKKEYGEVLNEARKELELDKTVATIFDFSNPKSTNDTGIGTSFSDDSLQLTEMLKTMCGVNAVLLQPQGEISDFVRSPYSGTSFSLGTHIIDLNKLETDEYGNLLNEEDFNNDFINRTTDREKVNYKSVFADDGQKAMLKKAYVNFKKLPETSVLKDEFRTFTAENESWLKRDSLFEAAAEMAGTPDVNQWNKKLQNVFDKKDGNKKMIKQLENVTDSEGYNIVDYNNFVQYIADKQQKETHKNFNDRGIEIYGDCPIGFSQKDVWTHKYVFQNGYEFGCKDNNGGPTSSWAPAFDFEKIKSDAGELLKEKFDLCFSRYDGVRIDAAWQLTHPYLVKTVTDSEGNRTVEPIEEQKEIPDDGKYVIENIIMKSADEHGVPRDKVFFELLGGDAYKGVPAAKEAGGTLIHITRYCHEGWGSVKFYEAPTRENAYQNMQPGQYIIGPGTHDDESLIQQANMKNEGRIAILAHDLNLNEEDLKKSKKEFASAITAELFTTKNQFETIPDIMGSEARLNIPEVVSDDNWGYRVATNFEKEYHENLSNGKGLNAPDAMSKAIRAKGGNTELADKLDKFAQILKRKGPNTTKRADNRFGKNSINYDA